MITKMKELCEQSWCSQLVANNKRTRGGRIAYTMTNFYADVVDCSQTWINTQQGSRYWASIDEEWRNNH